MPRYPSPERGTHLDFSKLVAERISVRRRELDMTQAELGDHLGVSREMITRVETGRAELSLGDMPALALALRVPISYFYSIRNSSDAVTVLNSSIKIPATVDEPPLTDRGRETAAARKMVSGLALYVSGADRGINGGINQEMTEMLGSLDPDLRHALRSLVYVVYGLQEQRPVPAPSINSRDSNELEWSKNETVYLSSLGRSEVVQYLVGILRDDGKDQK